MFLLSLPALLSKQLLHALPVLTVKHYSYLYCLYFAWIISTSSWRPAVMSAMTDEDQDECMRLRSTASGITCTQPQPKNGLGEEAPVSEDANSNGSRFNDDWLWLRAETEVPFLTPSFDDAWAAGERLEQTYKANPRTSDVRAPLSINFCDSTGVLRPPFSPVTPLHAANHMAASSPGGGIHHSSRSVSYRSVSPMC